MIDYSSYYAEIRLMQSARFMQTRALRAMQAARKVAPAKSLVLPASAQFGGMMGMGELADILAGKCDPNDAIKLWEMDDRVGILLTLEDKPGALNDALQILKENSIDMTSIQSRPPKTVDKERVINFNIDFKGSFEDENVKRALD